jgi:hypothetical protein
MSKIPTYIECFAKFVSFLGMDYDENVGRTNDFKIKERQKFNTQKKHYPEYVEKIKKLLAGEDEEKQLFVETCLDISENIARELTSKNYYTYATNKRIMSGLLVFYYIPHIASLMALYKKKFNIPACLIEHDFMLPYFDEKEKIISTTIRLKLYLRGIRKEIIRINERYDNSDNPLSEEYIEGFKTVPSDMKYDEIIKFIKTIPELNERIDEISFVIKTAIISGRIYQKLLAEFDGDEIYVISLMDYFRKFLIASERLFKENSEIQSNFDGDVELYVHHYSNLFLYSIATRKRIGLAIEKDNSLFGYEEIEDEIGDCREKIFENFEDFISMTVSCNKDDVLKIDMKNLLTLGLHIPQEEKSNFYTERASLLEFIDLLDEIDDMFMDSEFLHETTIEQLLHKIENHPLHKSYEHEFLYYSALNYLAKNEFDSAYTKIEDAAKQCEKVTAGQTQLKIAEKFIILKLLTNPNETSFFASHLNPAIKIMIDAEKQSMSIIPILDSEIGIGEEKIHEKIYLDYVLNIMARFNSEGYARYKNVECIKYNPFEKLEKFVGDFYDSYENDTKTYESDKIKIRTIIKKLTPYHNNLVTLYQYKAIDVFEPINFATIGFSCLDFKIDNKNIFKLWEDKKTLNLIFEAVST